MISYVHPKVAAAVLDSTGKHKSTRTNGTDVRYIGAADTAKLIRSALKLAFPDVRFSVKSHNYSGGSSVRVLYTNGPALAKVDAVLGGFVGHDFDGSIDMAFSSDCYITRSGGVGFAHTSGTAGSRGAVPAADAPVPYMANIVVFTPYISVDRTRTDPRPDWRDHWANVAFDAMDLPPAPVNRYA